MSSDSRHRVVIVGAGFAGLYAARKLSRDPVDVTIVDSANHHLFQPLLYQVATGALSPGDIASPVRGVLRNHARTKVIKATVRDVDPDSSRVILDTGELHYDTLILAAGLESDYFGHDSWRQHAQGLKSLGDAIALRQRVLEAFEQAELEHDEARRKSLLTVAIIGAGPTGVEMAGAVAELARDTLRRDFRNADPRAAKIVLIEGGERILSAFKPELSDRAANDLRRMGVEVITGALVTEITDGELTLTRGEDLEKLPARTIIWSAGIRGASIGRTVARKLGAELDKWGRIKVGPTLSVPGHEDVLIAGDLASVERPGGFVPMVAPAAIQQGKYVAKALRRRLKQKPVRPFSYFDKGSLAVIGRNRAVVQIGRLGFGGVAAWLIWILIHIAFLIEFDNKVLVMVQWAWTYLTRKRGARLIID